MALLFQNLFKGSKPENGELTINLNLTIKIEADGSLQVTPSVSPASEGKVENKVVPTLLKDKIHYEIPDDFGIPEGNLINFGKNV